MGEQRDKFGAPCSVVDNKAHDETELECPQQRTLRRDSRTRAPHSQCEGAGARTATPAVQKARWAVGTLPRLAQGVLPRTADAVTDKAALSGRARGRGCRVLRVELAKGVDSTCVARLLSSDIVFL